VLTGPADQPHEHVAGIKTILYSLFGLKDGVKMTMPAAVATVGRDVALGDQRLRD